MHFALIHALAVLVCLARYGTARWMTESPDPGFLSDHRAARMAAPRLGVYLIWAASLRALYPLCRLYAAVKQRRTRWWLRYI